MSIPRSYVQTQVDRRATMAKTLLDFKENIDRPLAAILTLNTIAHTVGAVGVGQQAAAIWGDGHPFIIAFVVPALMTLAILIISEIIPKTLGALYWRAFASFSIAGINLTIKALWPLVVVCQAITQLLSRSQKRSTFSRQDFLALTKIGSREGQIDEKEAAFIQNLLALGQVRLKDIMTPRTVVFRASEALSIQEFYQEQDTIQFSRVPVHAEGDPDNITGFVLTMDLFEHLCDGQGELPLERIRRPIQATPDNTNVFKLFNECIQNRDHIVLIVDEHGAFVGLVTLEDIFEEVLGQEIVDETDTIVDMQAHARTIQRRVARD